MNDAQRIQTIDNNSYGTLDEPGTLVFQRRLPGPVERVWEYLTDSEKRGRWLASGEMEMRVGGKVELIFRNAELSPVREQPPAKYAHLGDCVSFTGEVTKFDPPRLLAYTWGESSASGEEVSEVTFELEPRGQEVLLTLTHRRLADDRDMRISVLGGWHTHLQILIEKLGGRPASPFWSTHAKLEQDYDQRLA